MSAAIGAPVTVMNNAGEGGAWGIALLALFALCGGDLEAFLGDVFKNVESVTLSASEKEKTDFAAFMETYKKGLATVRLASEVM